MSRKRFTPEQIIGKLREAEMALAQGQTVVKVCRNLGTAEQTFYRWRREYGGINFHLKVNKLNSPFKEEL